MTVWQQVITILVAALATLITRFLPFLIFPAGKKTPAVINKLSYFLPGAVLGMLVVYCYKDLPKAPLAEIFPQALASLVVIGIHFWKRNLFLSIFLGTFSYLLLLRIF